MLVILLKKLFQKNADFLVLNFVRIFFDDLVKLVNIKKRNMGMKTVSIAVGGWMRSAMPVASEAARRSDFLLS